MTEEEITVRSIVDASVAASLARRFAERCGLEPKAATEIGIVARELATNMARHANEGVLYLRLVGDTVELEAVDCGDGAPEDLARSDPGVVDARGRARDGLGQGLAVVRRLTDSVEARPAPGRRGLAVVARRRKG